MSKILEQDIKFLPGVGPKRAELFNKELKIFTFGDLIRYYPFKYIDRTKFYKIREVNSSLPYVQIKGEIISAEIAGTGNRQRLNGLFRDETGSLDLVWFQGVKWQKDNLKLNTLCVVFGKPSEFGGRISIVHPEMELLQDTLNNPAGLFQGYYNTTEEMKKKFLNSKAIHKIQLTLTSLIRGKIEESLPDSIINRFKLMPLENALCTIHNPENTNQLKKAQYRLKFEELFFIQLKILSIKIQRESKFKGFPFAKIGYNFNTFYNDFLPFRLTEAQKKVLKEIRRDVAREKQMNRLLQGDVGSGKTLVALMTMLMALDNGFQACLMAPTEILAQQHYNSITKFLNGMHISVKLLTGSTRQSERKEISMLLESGELNLLVGTHALLEDTVSFSNLGLVVIDEQHRFGVAQRARLWEKNDTIPPHVLVMTATPIPRTLAMTVYGDLDMSVIDELPPGRKPIQTMHFFENRVNQINGFLKNQILQGRQVYVVYPLIEESEKLDFKNLEEGYQHFLADFSEFRVAMVHGRMKPSEKEEAMQDFKSGKTHILVATTVIEVGVDVPNASVMVIESAERFGLSQLHQLRGRVGRGADQSYCLLVTSFKLSEESRKRIDIMVRTNDGFEISEMDLKLRGPGDMEGTQQSGIGFDLRIANLSRDSDILNLARDVASEILRQDPLLSMEENKVLGIQLKLMKKTSFNWGSIS